MLESVDFLAPRWFHCHYLLTTDSKLALVSLLFYTAHVPTRPIFWAQVVYFSIRTNLFFYKRLFLFLKIAIVVIFHIIYLLVICFPTVFRCEIYQQSIIFRAGTEPKLVFGTKQFFIWPLNHKFFHSPWYFSFQFNNYLKQSCFPPYIILLTILLRVQIHMPAQYNTNT